jgi:hypothetical protein
MVVTFASPLVFDIEEMKDAQRKQYSASLSLGPDCSPTIASGDINGDGYIDLIMAEPEKDLIELVLGNSEDLYSSHERVILTIKGKASSRLGCSLTFIRNFNGDMSHDLAIGAPGEKAVYILFGKSDIVSDIVLGDNLAVSDGIRISNSEVNSIASAGDVNGDGFDDLLLGDYGYSSAYLIFGSTSTPSTLRLNERENLSPQIVQFASSSINSAFGWSVSSIGDFNRDGYSDLAISSFIETHVYVVLGGPEHGFIDFWRKNSLESLKTPSTRGFSIRNDHQNDYFGWTLSMAGDVNKDGFDDLAISAWRKAAVYTLFGRSSNDIIKDLVFTKNTLMDEDWKNPIGAKIVNTNPSSAFGLAITSGDCNKDGIEDLLIGSHGERSLYCIFGSQSFASQKIDLNTPRIFDSLPNSAFGGSLNVVSLGRSSPVEGLFAGDSLLSRVHLIQSPFKACKKPLSLNFINSFCLFFSNLF